MHLRYYPGFLYLNLQNLWLGYFSERVLFLGRGLALLRIAQSRLNLDCSLELCNFKFFGHHLKSQLSISIYNFQMQKNFYLAILLLAPLINACLPGQVLSPQGCINSCQYSGCQGEPLLPIHDPVCAYTRNGWTTFSSLCRACSSSIVIGYKDGRCTGLQKVIPGTPTLHNPPPTIHQAFEQECSFLKPCPESWQICLGTCMDICIRMSCPMGTSCLRGQCIQNIY